MRRKKLIIFNLIFLERNIETPEKIAKITKNNIILIIFLLFSLHAQNMGIIIVSLYFTQCIHCDHVIENI